MTFRDDTWVVRGSMPSAGTVAAGASGGCEAFALDLGPFVDGELDGSRMLRMSRHLETCATCSAALEDMQSVGEVLRGLVPADPPALMLDGLAASVISRSRAESAVSWRATMSRGLDGWHWAIVGGGAVAATFVSTSLLSVILAFGPAPQREDSLSAMMTDLGSPAGFLFVYASPTGEQGQDVVMLQVENGRPAAPRLVSDLVVSRVHGSATEAELVERFQEIVTRGGRVVSLDSLNPEQRATADALLDEIQRLRSRQAETTGRSFQVHEVRLVTSTGVSAKRS
jgi:anti-sigma factor RsiW